MNIKEVKNFKSGWINFIESRSIARGAFSDGENWEQIGDVMRLRYGYQYLGTYSTTVGKVNGMCRAFKENGDEIIFAAFGVKLKYSTDGETWTEVGTNLLYNEDTSLETYTSTAGRFVIVSSPNLGHIYKINIYNPGSYSDIFNSAVAYGGVGHIKIIDNAMWVWGVLKQPNTVYRGHIDLGTQYTNVDNEALGTGDGGKDYTFTLAFKAAGARRTCFNLKDIKDEDSIETFTDNRDGTLTGSAGGTGTINYTSGVLVLHFAANVANGKAITGDYSWEDSATNGITDFSYSATRVATEGTYFVQPSGGAITNILPYDGVKYCIHEKHIWTITTPADDVNFINSVFRENIGCKSLRGSFASGEGIYIAFNNETSVPSLGLVSYVAGTTRVEPKSISPQITIPYYIDKAVVYEWGDFVVMACRETNSTNNNILIVYNKVWKNFALPYNISANCFMEYDGKLIGGDSLTTNCFEMFNGFADYNSDISNSAILSDDDLDLPQILKKLYKLRIFGTISRDQSFKVYANIDNSGYVELGTIEGTGDYVDFGQAVTIGSQLIGSGKIGGSDNSTTVYPFDYLLTGINDKIGKFEHIKLKFEAQRAGYVSVSQYAFCDYRIKEKKQPIKYRTSNIK